MKCIARWFAVLSAAFILTACAHAQEGADAQPEPTNVIVILLDDAGYNDFGFTGGTEIRTPNMDALAAKGTVFDRAYVSASVCCPSRAGLLTGRYQQRFGHESNGPNKPLEGYTWDDMGLSVDEKTIGDAFQSHGYRTQVVGKWHMGDKPQFFPLERGFDEYFGLAAGHRHYFTHTEYETKKRDNFRVFRNREMIPESEITYLTNDQTHAALDFIERHKDQPFFIYLSYTAVHAPVEPQAVDYSAYAGIKEERRRGYAGMMKSVDDNVGRLVLQLERLGLTDNTLIVLTNDNGGPEHANSSDNGPDLKGGKGSSWEGGNRVPMFMTLPGVIPAGERFSGRVSTLDILPTSLAAAGLDYPFDKKLDGVNLLPYLDGQATGHPHETMYWKRGKVAAIREGKWKLLTVEGASDILFDMEKDPLEASNIVLHHPDEAKALKAKLNAWIAEHAAPRWDEGEGWIERRRKSHEMEPVSVTSG